MRFLASLLISLGTVALAQSSAVSLLENKVSSRLHKNIARLAKLPRSCFNCTPGGAEVPAPVKCESTYADLYKNDVVNVDFVMGYTDTHPLVEDKKMVEGLRKQLTRDADDCYDDEYLCGFTQDPDDLGVVSRLVQGPDGKLKTLRVRLTNSAASDVHLANVEGGKPSSSTPTSAQLSAGGRAKKTFMDGLKKSDAVIYVGHARGGGGPSFEPPRMSANGDWNLDWHRNNPTTRNEMVQTLAARKPPLKMLGLFACYADRDFASRIRTASPQTGVVATRGEVKIDALFDQGVAMLDSIVNLRCQNETALALQIEKGDKNGVLPATANVTSLFHYRDVAAGAVESPKGPLPARVLSNTKGLVQEPLILPTGPASLPGSGNGATVESQGQGTAR